MWSVQELTDHTTVKNIFFNDVSVTWQSTVPFMLFHMQNFYSTSQAVLQIVFICFLLVIVDISHIAAIPPIGEMHSQLHGFLTVTLQTCNWELILPCIITVSVLY